MGLSYGEQRPTFQADFGRLRASQRPSLGAVCHASLDYRHRSLLVYPPKSGISLAGAAFQLAVDFSAGQAPLAELAEPNFELAVADSST